MTTLPNDGRVCQTCRFCEHQPPARYCRIRAPIHTKLQYFDQWPAVSPLDWCGEHQWHPLHAPKPETLP